MNELKKSPKAISKTIIALCILSSIPIACRKDTVENISEENKIPVNINSVSHIQTRVADETFEDTDEIGLYLLQQPNKITEERQVDNMRFTFKQNTWTPDQIIYYPSANDLCDFIAYYPYRKNAFAEGSSLISCKTATDQNGSGNYAGSDFLLSEKSSVTPSSEAVPLVFKHKLAEICIDIKPGTGFGSVEELAAANPVVSLKGISTQGDYDIYNKTFTNLSDRSDITPTGQFKADGDKLTGKHAIVIPQEIAGDKIFIEVKAGGKSYNFTFGDKHSIAPATKEICTLTIKRAAPQGNIQARITDWENNSSVNGDLNESPDINEPTPPSTAGIFCIPLPDFSQSSVYKAMNGNLPLAEICKEYLLANGVDNLATVVYPINNGIANLTKGYVAQVFDRTTGNILTANQHGGMVSWDESANTLVYQSGTKAASSNLYIDKEGTISSDPISNATTLTIAPDMILDNRDQKSYRIVKIATQYWMGENLAAESFNDGKPITNANQENIWITTVTNSQAAYSIKASNHYYTFAAATGNIAPTGWKVPSYGDWIKLQTYIQDDASLITSWEGSSNLTGLSVTETNYRDKDGKYPSPIYPTSFFWAIEHSMTVGKTIDPVNAKNQGNSIRCIKE